jgi:hypothetical protein
MASTRGLFGRARQVGDQAFQQVTIAQIGRAWILRMPESLRMVWMNPAQRLRRPAFTTGGAAMPRQKPQAAPWADSGALVQHLKVFLRHAVHQGQIGRAGQVFLAAEIVPDQTGVTPARSAIARTVAAVRPPSATRSSAAEINASTAPFFAFTP